MNSIIILFVGVTLFNVIISTTRSLFTVKGGMYSAAIVNAICYGFYTYVIVLTANADFSIHIKALITFGCNIIGVLLVKYLEQKLRKDKLWVFTATCNQSSDILNNVVQALKDLHIKLVYNEIEKDKLYSLQVFSNTQKESELIIGIFNTYDIKYCAMENAL